MRIMIVGNVYSIHVRKWAEYFTARHEVYLAYLPKNSIDEVKKLFENDKINLVPLGSPTITNVKRIPRKVSMSAFGGKHYMTLGLKELKVAIAEIKPDLIHAHYLPDYGWLASQTGFRPLFLSAWGFTLAYKGGGEDKKYTKQMFASADTVFAGDESAKARLVEYGCDPEKIFIQPWGVDTARFSPDVKVPELKIHLFGNQNYRVVTLVRHLVDICDISTLVEAIPLISRDITDARFLIVGDGPEKANLEKLSKRLDVADKIVFTGNVPNDELHKYLAASDLYVDTPHPTKAGGGIGVALMEAMSSGLPCLVAERPGAEYGVRTGLNGEIFVGGDSDDLARKAIEILKDNRKMELYGKNSRELALEIGDFAKNMRDILRLYEKYLNTTEKLFTEQ